MKIRRAVLMAVITLFLAGSVCAAEEEIPSGDGLKQFEEERTDAYAARLEEYLRSWLVDQYPERAAKVWKRDYSSTEAFLASVAPNRKRWAMVIKPPELTISGELERRSHPALGDIDAEWLTLPLGRLTAEGLLAVPPSATTEKPVPLVIAQHGLGSHPERTFGVLDDGDHYHSYGRELFKAGFCRAGTDWICGAPSESIGSSGSADLPTPACQA